VPLPASRPEVRLAKQTSPGITRLRSREKKRAGERQWRIHDVLWQDPVPWVWGSLPEKLVFAWLWQKGVPFRFQDNFPDCPDTLTVEDFRPDFVLPQFKVIIEVQGEYWHSMPEQAEKDAYKFAVYEYMGWKCYWMWETEILTDLATLMSTVTELNGYTGIPGTGWTWVNQIDDLKALRTTNSNSRIPPAPAIASRTTGRKSR
jgi:G:T-mismatch repair DNA endonuclease (very short patch repair protein)